MTKPIILLSNDDGVRAEGLLSLALALAPLGRIVVVAPSVDQSAVSHAMSLRRPLRLLRHDDLKSEHGAIEIYSVDGTPTDAIYMAAHHVLAGQHISLVASGINHGANLGDDVLYSGTVSAAMEGASLGVPSIAFSLVANHDFDFTAASTFARDLCKAVLDEPLLPGALLNVNVPKRPTQKDFAVTALGRHAYSTDVQERKDPRGQSYYWIGGQWAGFQDLPGTDCKAVAEGYISVTPIEIKLSSLRMMPLVQKLKLANYKGLAQYEQFDSKA